MSTNHFFAGRCVDIIRGLASKWHIQLPDGAPNASPFRADSAVPSNGRPQSTFFAASIPRLEPSRSGANSNNSQRSAMSDSLFGPPSTHSQHPQQDSGNDNVYYDDPFATMDPMQMNSAFWLPFPAQGMPTLQPQASGSVEMFGFGESNPLDHWQSFHTSHMDEGGGPAVESQQQEQYQARQAVGPSRITNERIGGNIGTWNWQ